MRETCRSVFLSMSSTQSSGTLVRSVTFVPSGFVNSRSRPARCGRRRGASRSARTRRNIRSSCRGSMVRRRSVRNRHKVETLTAFLGVLRRRSGCRDFWDESERRRACRGPDPRDRRRLFWSSGSKRKKPSSRTTSISPFSLTSISSGKQPESPISPRTISASHDSCRRIGRLRAVDSGSTLRRPRIAVGDRSTRSAAD